MINATEWFLYSIGYLVRSSALLHKVAVREHQANAQAFWDNLNSEKKVNQ